MVKVKICGITNLADAQYVAESGASALGFIFAESPRKVSKEIVKEIIEKIPKALFKVGVFVNEDIDTIIRIADYCKLTHIQLHGDESPEYCKKILYPVIKAFRVKDSSFNEELKRYKNIYGFLLDAYQKRRRGGTGKQFDYSLIKDIPRERIFFLSGGLNPDNVIEAIRAVKPDWIDIASGVELSPGKKDKSEINRLFQILRIENLLS